LSPGDYNGLSIEGVYILNRLPVIVGFGGINPAGRSSGHHGYRRLVFDQLSSEKKTSTLQSLAALMNCEADAEHILSNTLIRKITDNLFDPAYYRANKQGALNSLSSEPLTFSIRKSQLPESVPSSWTVVPLDDGNVKVTTDQPLDVLFPDGRASKVNSAGQLPSGFNPEALYQSRSHPRGLQLTVFGASDAISSLGIPWEQVRDRVPGDQIAVYASSAMGQLDFNGSAGMLQSALLGKRVSAKNCPLGLAEMTADFVNAYILGSVGATGANVGACATFLYNLRQGISDIRSGQCRVAVIGSSEAPITPEVIEGYRTMGALAEDDPLCKLDGITDGQPDHQRACRPFADNCGFTLAEASQFVILFDDALAVELGAQVHGAVADVYVNADGFKKSIPGPGIGNYLTVGKAMGVVRAILGDDALKHHTYMQAHGTGTPQNRVTESHIFSEMARAYGIKEWPVTAIKAYVGHSLACASGDQIIASLGFWQEGILPGINTIERIAEDVHQDRLNFLLAHQEMAPTDIKATFINSKGFGGNNATAAILSPSVTEAMLQKRHGKNAMATFNRKQEGVKAASAAYDAASMRQETSPIYRFGEGVVEGSDLDVDDQKIAIPGMAQPISLAIDNPFKDMC